MADEVIKDEEAAFEEPTEEQTPENETETPENEEEDDKQDESKDRRAAIAQKKHWRNKALSESKRVKELETELTKLRGAVKKPTDDAEVRAQEYIRDQARRVFEELQDAKQKEESRQKEEFNEAVNDILEDNPDIAEAELLDAIEEYEVEPNVALKILKKQTDRPNKKPKMPAPKRAGNESKETPDDSKKSMWDILKEESAKIKGK